ncbi:mannose 6-phosphate receptor domain-containing protein [Athelia psychrophila]|uniref:Mannose 6-phosphate receptor domain-containing protein n=1 Tax=Athelia psychrophila TaxID=1759441 RepID=A0A166ML37_9AGAM|nr:mannose 6-phosphate receptor domain-containing protein [Fibularhizoctonia sp. CBS 109695]
MTRSLLGRLGVGKISRGIVRGICTNPNNCRNGFVDNLLTPHSLQKMSPRLCILSLICLLGALGFATASEKACTIHDGDNFFDLRSLSASKDYGFTTEGGRDVVLNVCRGVAQEVWNIDDADTVGAFIRQDHGDFSLGQPNTTLSIKGGHPLLYMGGGSKCPNSDMRATTAIQFICDASVFAVGTPELIAQVPEDDANACAFFLEWRTHVACPGRESGFLGVLVVIFVIMLVLSMLYLMPGTLPLPSALSRAFSAVGDFFSSLRARLFPSRTGLNPSSHHWDAGVGGSRFGSGARGEDEEEAMLAEEEEQEAVNPWSAEEPHAPAGIDSAGVIRL